MKIIIIGLGLIGGSIAKALSSTQDYEILAFDSDQQSIKNALHNQTIQGSLNSLNDLESTEYSDSFVIISTPPSVTNEHSKIFRFFI